MAESPETVCHRVDVAHLDEEISVHSADHNQVMVDDRTTFDDFIHRTRHYLRVLTPASAKPIYTRVLESRKSRT